MSADAWLMLALGFGLGVVVCVKVVVWLAMKAAKIMSDWIMDHM